MCVYFFAIRLVYTFSHIKLNEVLMYVILALIVAISWLGLKKWQYGKLNLAERIVSKTFNGKKLRLCGILSVLFSMCSILGVMAVSIFALEGYTYWR